MTVRELRELCELAEAQLGPDWRVMLSRGDPADNFERLREHQLYAAPPESHARKLDRLGDA